MPDWSNTRTQVVTPSGMTIEYEAQPKRRYLIDGDEVGSVTTILKCLDKPALSWWGMCVGINALLELRNLGVFDLDAALAVRGETPWYEFAKVIASGVVSDNKLSVNHVRDEAADRGQSVHDALERWAATGEFPDPQEYPPWEQGYVIAMGRFLTDMPSLEPTEVELIVGSKEHGFAGRLDLRATTSQEHVVVTKTYPKSPPKTLRVPPGLYTLDCKTSADVFPEHALQLAAYEGAAVEGGWDATDGQFVLHCGSDGRYQARRSRSTLEDFLAVKAANEALRRAEEGIKVAFR